MYALVILTVTLLPPQLAQVVQAYKEQRNEEEFRLKEKESHVILCGDISSFEMREALDSLFNDTSLEHKVESILAVGSGVRVGCRCV